MCGEMLEWNPDVRQYPFQRQSVPVVFVIACNKPSHETFEPLLSCNNGIRLSPFLSYTHYYGKDTAHKLEKEKIMKVLFVAGFGPIVSDMQESAAFYRDSLGLSFQEEADGYFHTEDLQGAKTFALWPLSQVAQSCFGVNEWPADLPPPTSWLEFDVEDVAEATEEFKAKDYKLLIAVKKEPWGQTVTRLLSPEGVLVGLTYTPLMRKNEAESE